MIITVQPNELVEGKLSKTHVEQAVKAIRVEGYVVIENIINHEHLDILRERMDADSQELIKAKSGVVRGCLRDIYNRDHLRLPLISSATSLRILTSFRFQRSCLVQVCIIISTMVIQTVPGSSTQPLHRDGDHLWQNLEVAHPAAEIVVNISPQDTIEENGSVELWPGSHLDVSGRHIDEAYEAERREIAPPVRGNAKKGSALIRDMRPLAPRCTKLV